MSFCKPCFGITKKPLLQEEQHQPTSVGQPPLLAHHAYHHPFANQLPTWPTVNAQHGMQSWPRSSSGILETSEVSLRRLRGQHLSNITPNSAETTFANLVRYTVRRHHPVLWRKPPLVICCTCRSTVYRQASQGCLVFHQDGTPAIPSCVKAHLVCILPRLTWSLLLSGSSSHIAMYQLGIFVVSVRSKVSGDTSCQWRTLPSWNTKPLIAVTLT